jgi:kynurenine formamidase
MSDAPRQPASPPWRIHKRLFSLALLAIVAALASGQPAGDETPIGPKWWPSPWGPDDQRGAANRITGETVLRANKLVTKGQIYQMGHLYENGMPMIGKRHFSLTIPGSPTYPPSGKNGLVAFDELVSGELGQVGTQLDGLGHIGVRMNGDDYFYNGFKRSEFADPYGHKKLGIENVGVFYTRGVLLDVAGMRKTERLPIGYAITPDDLQACLDAAKLKIEPGDVVLVRTGHGTLWMKDNKAFNDGEPGVGLAAAKWLSERKIVLLGADNWSIEVVPSEDKAQAYPVHQWNIVRNGIYHLENLDLEQLAADKVYEFAFIFSPLRLKGATGSPGNPIAVR